ncbi:MAG: TonB-dependent receptor domain-containing protein, partial [Saprospiraceae bacterium]
MKLKSLILLIALALASSLMAQRTITGRIVDDENNPLIGATVLVKGTTIGTITDFEGNYSIDVAADATTLVFSYTGYETQEIALGTSDVIDVTLQTGAQMLSEVVVTGQGVGIERRRLTSTVDVITADQIQAAPVVRIDQILQSRLPGAQVRLSSGQPGTASLIRNRGPISANASATPVILIDGVRVDNLNSNPQLNVATGGAASSAISDIPVESIERVEFIRGGAATTLYGADAANGVLQIFTKKGTKGAARFNFEALAGILSGERTFLHFPQTGDVYFKDGFEQSYRLGVDGGSDKVTYNFSGNYYRDNGTNNLNEQNRTGFRSSLNAIVSPTLTYTGSAAFSSAYFTRDQNANSSFSRFGQLEAGAYGDLAEASAGFLDSLNIQLKRQGELTDITESVRRFQTSHTLQYLPFKNFSSRLTFGLDSRRSKQQDIQTNAYLIHIGAVPPGTDDQGSITLATRDFLAVTADLSLQYKIEAGDFSFITGAGGQLIRESDEQYGVVATDVAEGSETINNAADVTVQDFLRTIAFGGFYFSENIGFKNKFFIDAAARFDGNSAFGEDIGLVDIYRIGLTYTLSDEPFMQSIGNILPLVRLRANFGQATNFPTPFARDRVFNVNPYNGLSSVTFGNPGNSNLRPERVDSYEAGVDLGLFNGLLSLRFTYYDNTTRDAIFTPPSVPSSGQFGQEANVGEVSNKGIELETTIRLIDRKDLSLAINGSLTTNENLVVSSGGSPEFTVGGFTFLGTFVKEGLPLGYLRGSRPTFDAEGKVISVERNAFLGTTNPKGYGTFGLTFNWKRLNFFTSADYQYGAQAAALDDVLRFFNGIIDEDRIPEAAQTTNFTDLAGVWIDDTDFIKVRNIGLSYNVNVSGTRLSRLEVGLNLRNPFVWGKSGFDPEVTGAGIGAQDTFTSGGFGYGTES